MLNWIIKFRKLITSKISMKTCLLILRISRSKFRNRKIKINNRKSKSRSPKKICQIRRYSSKIMSNMKVLLKGNNNRKIEMTKRIHNKKAIRINKINHCYHKEEEGWISHKILQMKKVIENLLLDKNRLGTLTQHRIPSADQKIQIKKIFVPTAIMIYPVKVAHQKIWSALYAERNLNLDWILFLIFYHC